MLWYYLSLLKKFIAYKLYFLQIAYCWWLKQFLFYMKRKVLIKTPQNINKNLNIEASTKPIYRVVFFKIQSTLTRLLTTQF